MLRSSSTGIWHSVKGGATSYERSTGYRYSGKLAAFAEPVWGFRRGRAKGDRKWRRAIFLTKSVNNDVYVLANEQGVWLTRSIRRNAKPWRDECKLASACKGMPWDYQLGVLGSKTFPLAKDRNPKPAEVAEPVFEVKERLSGRLGEPSVPARSEAGVAEDVRHHPCCQLLRRLDRGLFLTGLSLMAGMQGPGRPPQQAQWRLQQVTRQHQLCH